MYTKIKEEFKLNDTDYFKEEMIRSLLRVILLRAERLKRSKEFSASALLYNDFNLFREQVEKNFSKTRNVKDYASALLMNQKKINTITQNVLGKSAKEFIDDRVILEVKRLLSHTSLSVQEISYQAGFDEPTNLVKFFKKYTGITPASFRNQE